MSKSHYDILGVQKSSTQEDIKKAYRKLALIHHPDKGGDENVFKTICESYEILSDPVKRKMYDFPVPLNPGGFTHTSATSDFFYNLFNNNNNSPGFGQVKTQMKKTPNITHKCLLTLEDFYAGKTVKFAISRKGICKECSGIGGWGKTNVNCIGCLGSGCRENQKNNMTIRTTCVHCRGKGTKVHFERMCQTCKTLGSVAERVVAEASFKPGASSGDRVILKGMSDSVQGKNPGDVIVLAAEKPHRIFKRKGNVLKCSIDINIKQSLCGFSAEISHLDGRIIIISRDEVTPPGFKIIVKNEGIPFQNGHMEVLINVVFPTKIPKHLSAKIINCLDELV